MSIPTGRPLLTIGGTYDFDVNLDPEGYRLAVSVPLMQEYDNWPEVWRDRERDCAAAASTITRRNAAIDRRGRAIAQRLGVKAYPLVLPEPPPLPKPAKPKAKRGPLLVLD